MEKFIISKVLFFLLLLPIVISAKNIVIVDVGSTGSRLHIYQYQKAINQAKDFKLIATNSISPGLSSISEGNIAPYLADLFSKKIIATLSQAEQKLTPVYFYATAGMRLLSAPEQKYYYKAVRAWLLKNTAFKIIDARTITGQEEGVYGWIALNFLRGFAHCQKMGLLDMGGASTQIAFLNKKYSNIKVELNHHIYPIFSVSFLGLGQNMAITQFSNMRACFNKGYPLPNGALGTGDYNQCSEQISNLLRVHHLPFNTGVLKSIRATRFNAISGFSHVARRFDLPSKFTIKQFVSAGKKWCHRNWSSLTQAVGDQYLFRSCFSGAYQARLLTEGYGFKINSDLATNREIQGQRITWTLGVLLCHGIQCFNIH